MFNRSQFNQGSSRNLFQLAAWMAATLVVAHTPHVLFYDFLGVPDPDNTLAPASSAFIDIVASILATMLFLKLGRDFLCPRSMIAQSLILAALTAMLNQQLFRSFIMDVIVSGDWIYCFVENLPRPLEYLAVATCVVVLNKRLHSTLGLIAASVAIGGLMVAVINPLIDGLFAKLVSSIEYLDTGNVFNPPYGWQVEVPSYLTFAEPVIASYLIASLIHRRLAKRPSVSLALFTLLLMSMAGAIMPTLVYSFYQKMSLGEAFLSEGQFGLQVLLLSLMTAVGWRFSQRSNEKISTF